MASQEQHNALHTRGGGGEDVRFAIKQTCRIYVISFLRKENKKGRGGGKLYKEWDTEQWEEMQQKVQEVGAEEVELAMAFICPDLVRVDELPHSDVDDWLGHCHHL